MAFMATAAKKAPGKKPVKKTTPARAPRTPAGAANPAPPVLEAKTIVVEGREIEVRMPTAEQLMAWQATLEAISELQVAVGEFEKIRTHIDRYYRIATGLFVNEDDREWLQEARLDGVVSIEMPSVLGMVTAVIEAYQDELPTGEREAYTLLPGGLNPEGLNRAQKRAAARKKA